MNDIDRCDKLRCYSSLTGIIFITVPPSEESSDGSTNCRFLPLNVYISLRLIYISEFYESMK